MVLLIKERMEMESDIQSQNHIQIKMGMKWNGMGLKMD